MKWLLKRILPLQSTADKKKKDDKSKNAKADSSKDVKVDAENITERIMPLKVDAANYSQCCAC